MVGFDGIWACVQSPKSANVCRFWCIVGMSGFHMKLYVGLDGNGAYSDSQIQWHRMSVLMGSGHVWIQVSEQSEIALWFCQIGIGNVPSPKTGKLYIVFVTVGNWAFPNFQNSEIASWVWWNLDRIDSRTWIKRNSRPDWTEFGPIPGRMYKTMQLQVGVQRKAVISMITTVKLDVWSFVKISFLGISQILFFQMAFLGVNFRRFPVSTTVQFRVTPKTFSGHLPHRINSYVEILFFTVTVCFYSNNQFSGFFQMFPRQPKTRHTTPEGMQTKQDCTILWYTKSMLGFEKTKF